MNGAGRSREPNCKRVSSASAKMPGNGKANFSRPSPPASCVHQLSRSGDSPAAKKPRPQTCEVISRQAMLSWPPKSERRAIKIRILMPSLPPASPNCQKKPDLTFNPKISLPDPDKTDLSSDEEVGPVPKFSGRQRWEKKVDFPDANLQASPTDPDETDLSSEEEVGQLPELSDSSESGTSFFDACPSDSDTSASDAC